MMSNEQARQLLAQQERTLAGPYLFLGFGKLDEQPVTAKAEALDAPAHETLEAVYREFRRVAPRGRFSIWVGCQLHPKTFRPGSGQPVVRQGFCRAYGAAQADVSGFLLPLIIKLRSLA
jgi:hypothetical protein